MLPFWFELAGLPDMNVWIILLVATTYVLLLFAIAWVGERRKIHARWRPFVYALTLCVYNTAWSFYGSVGHAVTHGLDFFAIYLGPILVLLFWSGQLNRIVRVAKSQNATSISDLLAARYGKSQWLGALVTITALLASLPYIALQLKGISHSFDILAGASQIPATSRVGPPWLDIPFVIAIAMAAFSILFGVRHSHVTDHHRGLMLAVAFESVMKLIAFFVVSITVLFEYHGEIVTNLAKTNTFPLSFDLNHSSWFGDTMLGAAALICLPQMFHAIVVENEQLSDLRSARKIFPIYLILFTLLLLPVAVAGIIHFGPNISATQADTLVISLPVLAGNHLIGLVAFLGGLSAASAMVIVTSVALSTMICNDLVVPLLFQLRRPVLVGSGDRTNLLLTIRRLAVVTILLLAWMTYRIIGDRMALVSIGLVAFVAIAQSAPALVGGMIWARGNLRGAVAGMLVGLSAWGIALVGPLLLGTDFTSISWIDTTLFRVLHIDADPFSVTAIISVGLNILTYIAVSLVTRPTQIERLQAVFFSTYPKPVDSDDRAEHSVTVGDLKTLAEHFAGKSRTEASFADWSEDWAQRLDDPADLEVVRRTELLLGGAIGAASARVMIGSALESRTLSRGEAIEMLGDASDVILHRHDLMRITLQHMTQGVCLFDSDLKVMLWNENWNRLLDLPEDLTHVGMPMHELVGFLRDRGEYGEADLAAQLTQRDLSNQRWPYRYERQRPNGTVLELTYVRMVGGGLVGTVSDVTERRRVAEELHDANDKLELRVRQRTQELETQAIELRTAQHAAEHARSAQARMLAGLSHDLLQPVTAARLFATVLADRLQGGGPVEDNDKETTSRLNAALGSVDHLLADLLELSTLEADGLRPNIETVSVADLLDTLGSEFDALGQKNAVTVSVVSSSAHVRSDPRLLRRIIQNFVSNAVRYAQGGRIVIGCRNRGPVVSIEVWDNGPGIPPDQISEIFQDFHRLDRRGPGLGLGLSIVYRMAALLEHEVSVSSRPGVATGFSIAVPRTESPPIAMPDNKRKAASNAETSETEMLAGYRVHCIENDAAILAGLTAMLRSWGCQIVDAQQNPEVIIADFHLDNGITGLDRYSEICSKLDYTIPAVIITADRSPATQNEVRARNCILLYKPIKPAALRATLGQLRLLSAGTSREITPEGSLTVT